MLRSNADVVRSQGDAVRADIDWIKKQPLTRQDLADNIRGYIYDIKTGKLKEVI
jgi:carbonic anhydrase